MTFKVCVSDNLGFDHWWWWWWWWCQVLYVNRWVKAVGTDCGKGLKVYLLSTRPWPHSHMHFVLFWHWPSLSLCCDGALRTEQNQTTRILHHTPRALIKYSSLSPDMKAGSWRSGNWNKWTFDFFQIMVFFSASDPLHIISSWSPG